MEKNAKIYVAGHCGLVGSALTKNLRAEGFTNLLTLSHSELDLTRQSEVEAFFKSEKPEYVFLAAAKVGGIYANNAFPAEFIRDNIAIQSNVIHTSYLTGVRRLIFLGSSCIYPKLAPQPLREEYLLTGPLEETNRPYAVAKISGIEMCWSYNRQYGTRFLAVMPTNLYGPCDNYHPENSHVIPALIQKMHNARLKNEAAVTLWGTGDPRREFMYSDDMADACVYIGNLPDDKIQPFLAADRNSGAPPVINIGVGQDITIRELTELVRQVVGFNGDLVFDTSKPDGTPRKLMSVVRLDELGWRAKTNLLEGLTKTYQDFLNSQVNLEAL